MNKYPNISWFLFLIVFIFQITYFVLSTFLMDKFSENLLLVKYFDIADILVVVVSWCITIFAITLGKIYLKAVKDSDSLGVTIAKKGVKFNLIWLIVQIIMLIFGYLF